MAKAVRCRVSVGYTKNAGNYESARVEESIELELEEGEKLSQVLEQGREFLKVQVLNDAAKHVAYMKSQRK